MSPDLQSVPVSETSSQVIEDTKEEVTPQGTEVAFLLTQQNLKVQERILYFLKKI